MGLDSVYDRSCRSLVIISYNRKPIHRDIKRCRFDKLHSSSESLARISGKIDSIIFFARVVWNDWKACQTASIKGNLDLQIRPNRQTCLKNYPLQRFLQSREIEM